MNDKSMSGLSDFSKYGIALQKILQEVFTGSVIYEPVDTAFEYAQNQTKNNIKFPFISFYHEPSIEIDKSKMSFPSYHRGKLFEKAVAIRDDNNEPTGNENEKISKSVQNLYITMRYIFDIWGTTRNTAEKVAEELLFWLYSNQELTIKYFGQDMTFTFNISDNIVDNTDLTSYHEKGKLYRMSLSVSVDAALFRSHDYFNALTPVISIDREK